jgi:peptidoglycan/LPS O-acetylase OafA/YrhL
MQLTIIGSHLWSLCVEMQFYVSVAMLFGVAGVRGLMWIPVFCLAVTAGRIVTGTPLSEVTYFRVDEILAGGILALVFEGRLGVGPRRFLGWVLAGSTLTSSWAC